MSPKSGRCQGQHASNYSSRLVFACDFEQSIMKHDFYVGWKKSCWDTFQLKWRKNSARSLCNGLKRTRCRTSQPTGRSAASFLAINQVIYAFVMSYYLVCPAFNIFNFFTKQQNWSLKMLLTQICSIGCFEIPCHYWRGLTFEPERKRRCLIVISLRLSHKLFFTYDLLF